MKKRDFIKTTLLATTASLFVPEILKGFELNTPYIGSFTLPQLGYKYNALEPYIDKTTMEIHYTKHHQAYVTNLNKAAEGTNIEKTAVDEVCKNISKYPETVRNNAGGHYNHSMFWTLLKTNNGSKPTSKLAAAIDQKFGSFAAFKDEFAKASTSRFGSGWAWLIIKNDGELVITSTSNQDNPLMDVVEIKGTPILALDVWEHAYYLKYQNKRADYIAAFWNVVNWSEVNKRFEAAIK